MRLTGHWPGNKTEWTVGWEWDWMDSGLRMRLNGQWLGNEASTFADLFNFLSPLLQLFINKYLSFTSFGSKGHNQQSAQLPLRVDDSYVAFDGTSCCLWLNEEPLARRVDKSVAVGGVGVTVRVLCECHLCVPQLSEEMWWRVWKRKAINKTLCPSTILPLLSPFPPPSPFLLFLLTSFLPLFPFLSPLSHPIPPLQPSPIFFYPMVQVPCPMRKGFGRYSHTNLPIFTKITKHGWFHGLTAPYLMGITFTHAYKLQSLVHPTVQVPCP